MSRMNRFLGTLGALLFLSTTILVSESRAEKQADFVLESVMDGSKFEMSKFDGKVVVLHFLLKTECPLCLRYTHQYAKLAKKTPDVVHLFIKPDSKEEIKSWFSHLDKSEPDKTPKIYRDPDAKLAEKLGVPDGYFFHEQNVRFPALIALDKNGKELFRHVGNSNADRMPVKDFEAKLDSVLSESKDK